MAVLKFLPKVTEDFDRILAHLQTHDVPDGGSRVAAIVDALSVLEQNPLIGRPTPKGDRELVMGQRTKGYVALYRYVQFLDTVFVLAVRSQREAGYRDG